MGSSTWREGTASWWRHPEWAGTGPVKHYLDVGKFCTGKNMVFFLGRELQLLKDHDPRKRPLSDWHAASSGQHGVLDRITRGQRLGVTVERLLLSG